MTAAMLSTPARSSASWAGSRKRHSKRGCARLFSGTWIIVAGGRVCSAVLIVLGVWASPEPGSRGESIALGLNLLPMYCELDCGYSIYFCLGKYSRERHHSRRRFRYAFTPHYSGCFQAIAAGLRQTDDLLSLVGADAGRHS